MERSPIVIGNWKMNGSMDFVVDFCKEIASYNSPSNIEVAIAPPSLYLAAMSDHMPCSLQLAAQNVSEFNAGAYTGEVSAAMLQDFSCKYVLVGHSERRVVFAESNEAVARKFSCAAKAGLIPVLCVGETLKQRAEGSTFTIIEQQLLSALASLDGTAISSDFIVAYEPVWAIGTGQVAAAEDVQQVHAFIREKLVKFDKSIAKNIRILYGGSVKPENATELFKQLDVDGGLLGGASLKVCVFKEVIELCNKFCLQPMC